MKIEKYNSQRGQDIMQVKSGEIWDAPYYKGYSFVTVNNHTSLEKLTNYISKGFTLKVNNFDYIDDQSINTLESVTNIDYDVLLKNGRSNMIWRCFLKSEIQSIKRPLQFMMVKGIKVYSPKLLESGMIEFIDTKYHQPLGECIDKRQIDRDFFEYTHRFSQQDIDQICLEVIHFDLSKFGETKYLDESHKETFVLDMHHPDMNIYEQIKSYGLLEIDWQG